MAKITRKPDTLEDQILRIGRRGLRLVYDPARNPLRIEIIERIVRLLEPDLFIDNPGLALIRVFNRAISHLPDEPARDSLIGYRSLSLRELGQVLYDARPEIPLAEVPSYNSRFASVKKKLGPSPKEQDKTLERASLAVRKRLAAILLRMEREAKRATVENTTTQVADPTVFSDKKPIVHDGDSWSQYYEFHIDGQPHIDRPDYRARFDSLVAASKKLIVFVGLPGMGKTWLARAVTRDEDGSEAPRIRIVDGQISTPDLKHALRRCGVEVSNIVGHEREHLVTLVCGSHAPKFVVLDGFESTDELSSLMPGDTDSVVVATCRRKAESSVATDAVIPVREMSFDESFAIANLLADVARSIADDEGKRTSLARVMVLLSGHALGISRAFELVRDHKLSIFKLGDELEGDPLSFMRRLRTGSGDSFVADIERTLALVQDQDEVAYRLLEAASFLYLEDSRDSSFLQKYLEVTHRVPMSDRSFIGELRFRQAIDLLLSYMLIELHEKDLPQDVSDRPYTHVYVHPLVIRILRHRCERRAAEVAEGFIEVCNSYNKQYDKFEALQGLLQTVTLLGRILIDDDPPGASSGLQPWNRHTVPAWLSVHIIYLERILGSHFDNIFPTLTHWKEWARSRAPRRIYEK